jgi:catechol 2,3-dioxygenase-like lactoylglutathione lyase family enzyme
MLDSMNLMAFVATTDAERARLFYRDTLGLTLVEENAYALVFFVGSTVLRVQKVETLSAAPFTILGWHVPDIAAAVLALGARGVRFERYPYLEQDEAGVWSTPDGSKIAWFKDPDGNVLSLAQSVRQPNAPHSTI